MLPYLLLTLAIAGVGAFIIVRLTTDSLQERFHNQLVDAGRIVSERMVDFEEERLQVLRAVAGTTGVAQSLSTGDRAGLAQRVPQIIANSTTDGVELLNRHGREIYGWQRPPNQTGPQGEERAGADFSHLREVGKVLNGEVDAFGEKRVFLSQTPYGLMIFTVGPVYQGPERVGAVLVGNYISEIVTQLTENAVARVTLYDPQGKVIETSLGGGQKGVADLLRESPEQYRTILNLLRESSNQYPVVVAAAEAEVPLRRVHILSQEYTLAYGDWRLRGQSLGLFSVALPNNFIVSAAANSRNWLSLLFSLATICVFALGFFIAQRIIRPLHWLVQTALAVAEGDLARRTGIKRSDEIGSLAHSFDLMTDHLVERNYQLIGQASKLTAILDSIGDGVIVLNPDGVVISTNPAARQILANSTGDFLANILHELPAPPLQTISSNGSAKQSKPEQPRRYKVGKQYLSALITPVTTPAGESLGTVIALRDVTRETEAEQLKDSFITSMSHELRTPLTIIKGNSDLLMLMGQGNLNDDHFKILQAIGRSANVLHHHINQIIDISEIQVGTLRLEKENLWLSELVEQVAAKWQESMEAKGLSVRVRLPKQDKLGIYGDAKRLKWALDHLWSNAYHYTLPGGSVEIHLYQDQHEGRLEVIDTGIGIAAADQPYLFTRFFRASHPATFTTAGVGLGL
ncbi:MAG: cache domain-containing protein, partial [Anaerolineae bacterium]